MGAAEVERGDVTRLLARACAGDHEAVDELLPLIYDDLHVVAERLMGCRVADHTLQATMIAHDCFLRLVREGRANWESRTHFFAVAATVMRQIRVDFHRRRLRQKRGGGAVAHELRADDAVTNGDAVDVLALDEALGRLATVDSVAVRIIELRFFGGLTMQEISVATGLPVRTAERKWSFARAWLKVQLTGDSER